MLCFSHQVFKNANDGTINADDRIKNRIMKEVDNTNNGLAQ